MQPYSIKATGRRCRLFRFHELREALFMSSERHFVTLITTIAAVEVSDTIHLLCRKEKEILLKGKESLTDQRSNVQVGQSRR